MYLWILMNLKFLTVESCVTTLNRGKKHLPVTKDNSINVKIAIKPYFMQLQLHTGFSKIKFHAHHSPDYISFSCMTKVFFACRRPWQRRYIEKININGDDRNFVCICCISHQEQYFLVLQMKQIIIKGNLWDEMP